jgi:hypothetical protein
VISLQSNDQSICQGVQSSPLGDFYDETHKISEPVGPLLSPELDLLHYSDSTGYLQVRPTPSQSHTVS